MSSNTENLPAWISAGQITEFYGLPRSTIHRYVTDGDFPAGRAVGPNKTLYEKDAVEAWFFSRPVADHTTIGHGAAA